MDAQVTTVILLTFKSDVDVSDSSRSAHQIWKGVLSALRALPGCLGVAWGLQEENKQKALVLVGKSQSSMT